MKKGTGQGGHEYGNRTVLGMPAIGGNAISATTTWAGAPGPTPKMIAAARAAEAAKSTDIAVDAYVSLEQRTLDAQERTAWAMSDLEGRIEITLAKARKVLVDYGGEGLIKVEGGILLLVNKTGLVVYQGNRLVGDTRDSAARNILNNLSPNFISADNIVSGKETREGEVILAKAREVLAKYGGQGAFDMGDGIVITINADGLKVYKDGGELDLNSVFLERQALLKTIQLPNLKVENIIPGLSTLEARLAPVFENVQEISYNGGFLKMLRINLKRISFFVYEYKVSRNGSPVYEIHSDDRKVSVDEAEYMWFVRAASALNDSSPIVKRQKDHVICTVEDFERHARVVTELIKDDLKYFEQAPKRLEDEGVAAEPTRDKLLADYLGRLTSVSPFADTARQSAEAMGQVRDAIKDKGPGIGELPTLDPKPAADVLGMGPVRVLSTPTAERFSGQVEPSDLGYVADPLEETAEVQRPDLSDKQEVMAKSKLALYGRNAIAMDAQALARKSEGVVTTHPKSFPAINVETGFRNAKAPKSKIARLWSKLLGLFRR